MHIKAAGRPTLPRITPAADFIKNKDGEGDKEKEKKKQDDQKDQNKADQKDDQDKQQQKPKPNQLSPQQVKSLLQAMNNAEKKTQDKLNEKKGKGIKVKAEKDW